jgi:Nucleotidyl transferase AbiEii toxin, Type IV TA system
MSAQPPAEAPFEAFAKCGDRLLLIGGNAMIGYGSERLTQDCDCAVIASDERLVAVVLQPLGYLFKERFPNFARYAHLGGRRPVVDVMLLNASTFEKLRAQSRAIDMGGVVLHAPKPLHLVALKLHALKQNPKRLGKDWEDIQYLLSHYEWTVEELVELVERYASAESREMLRHAGFL